MIPKHLKLNFKPVPAEKSVITGPCVRFTVLTPSLIRMEYSENEQFEDRPSLIFWYRKQPLPRFRTIQTEREIQIITEKLHLKYNINQRGFCKDNLFIKIKENGVIWHFGDSADEDNLKGTYRTLDGIKGASPMENGLNSRKGWSIVDDSSTHVFDENGWITPRDADRPDGYNPNIKDIYFFGYANEYKRCVQDYCKISGRAPLIPRWALGNWWSRYWEYTQEELIQLILDFERYKIPLSVCIIDMDWHIVKNKYTNGWTGYTWNKELFPDYKALLKWLHKKKLKTALNLHPADGVHAHEDQYKEMALFMGLDPKSEKPVPFDIPEPKFVQGYFEILHHPYEEKGVDFWWMDWQQGLKSSMPGLDPLPWLNHLHYYNLTRNGKKRGFSFSRWGGLGSHHYPIGFSGDTIVAWESLAFQPYFTSTAANVGYGWWSHDIGGHYLGKENPELMARWVQYGVFSPILRIHCSKNPFQDRRPWLYDKEIFHVIKTGMQLRHALIPYIYSMAWRDHKESIPVVTPMYFEYPEKEEAYQYNSQYYFGTEMIAAPYVQPIDKKLNMSRQQVWLPAGGWFDFFSGEFYRGDRLYGIYGDINHIPVFAKAGAIIPLAVQNEKNSTSNPDEMEIYIFPGKNNSFELYEDDGETMAFEKGHYCLTQFSQKYDKKKMEFMINKPKGDRTVMLKRRKYCLKIRSILKPSCIEVKINKKRKDVKFHYNKKNQDLIIEDIWLSPTQELMLIIETKNKELMARTDRTKEKIYNMIMKFDIDNGTKLKLFEEIDKIKENPQILITYTDRLSASQIRALSDIL